MTKMVNNSIGIDISKAKIDVFRGHDGAFSTFSNTQKGFEDFQEWIGEHQPRVVVFEATGAYHAGLEQFFSGKLPLVKVNPRQAKYFVKSLGVRAKTDRSDARMLARMGEAHALVPDKPVSKEQFIIKDLNATRRGLVKGRTVLKNQLEKQQMKLTQDALKELIKSFNKQIEELDTQIKEHLEKDKERKEAVKILTSIPGIGVSLARVILIEMPEIGTLTKKAVAALTGLAPITRQSGQWQGKSYIHGGRKRLRDALYMPSLSAIQHNPDMKHTYESLKAAGKPSKVALVAVMRKLIILANTLVAEKRMWEEKRT